TYEYEGTQIILENGKVDVGLGPNRTMAAEVGPASPSGLKLKVEQSGSLSPKSNVILYEQTQNVSVFGDTIKWVEISHQQAKDLLVAVKEAKMSSKEIWTKLAAEHTVRTTTVSEVAGRAAGTNYFRGVEYPAKVGSARRLLTPNSRRGVLDLFSGRRQIQPSRPLGSSFNAGEFADFAAEGGGTALWIAASVYEHQQSGKSTDAYDLGRELAGVYTNPLMVIQHTEYGSLVTINNGIDTANRLATNDQTIYIGLVANSFLQQGEVSAAAVRKARGYMDSQLHWLSMSPRPGTFTMNEWARFHAEYAGLHGNIDVEVLYNKWIVEKRRSKGEHLELFPRTNFKFTDD
ncbi:MAG TPA: hypothetical protein VM260_07705, partial [Pirellula sp.]|nr:hypothetical protein [Pirellula sp.]